MAPTEDEVRQIAGAAARTVMDEIYQKALKAIQEEYPYPMYNHHDWERILRKRGFPVRGAVQEDEEPGEPEEDEESED